MQYEQPGWCLVAALLFTMVFAPCCIWAAVHYMHLFEEQEHGPHDH